MKLKNELNIACAPVTWPIGCGKEFKGVYHIHRDETICVLNGSGPHHTKKSASSKVSDNLRLDNAIGDDSWQYAAA